ncbi:MAG: 1-acylglycerol-3-phosphate O-acyltransferase [Chitinophagaceae bacterium]|nr:1-acylglycerol-3-phosphate O-acyltransferase [Oligoflexus sp.]
MKQKMSPLAGLRAFLFSVLVFGPLLLVNAMQMISILWLYVSPSLFRRYNSFWADTYWSFVVWLARNMGGFRVSFESDPLPPGENAIILSNHQSAVDIVVQLAFGQNFGRLGDMKFFAKDVLKYIPGPGWGMVFLDCIFMKRDWTRDRANVVRQLHKFKEAGAPIWVNLYPEGTRLKPSKLKAAQEFARAQNLPVPRNVLIPRIKGFLATVEGLEGYVEAIYDLTIAYPNGHPPTLWELLSAKGQDVKVEIKRYSVKDIPASPEQRAQWLMDLYQAKDNQLDRLIRSF